MSGVAAEGFVSMPLLNDLLALTPGEFEDEVARLLERQGYRAVQRVGDTGDLGVDIFCVDCVDEVGNRIVVQCKRYAPDRLIGSPAIQSFFGMVAHHGAHRGLYVTTSAFTVPARTLAEQRDIDLTDGQELVKLIVPPGPIHQDKRARVPWRRPRAARSGPFAVHTKRRGHRATDDAPPLVPLLLLAVFMVL